MERDRKTLILEFNGLPGCGKTTVSDGLVEKLDGLGYKVEDLNRYLENEEKDFVGKLSLYTKVVIDAARPSNIKFTAKLFSIYKDIEPFRLNRFKYMLMAYRYYLMYRDRLKEGNTDFIICNEGLIQSILATVHTDSLIGYGHIESAIKRALMKIENVYVANCIIDIEESHERIRSRNFDHGRIDMIDDDKALLKVLSSRDESLEIIRKTISEVSPNAEINLDMNLSPEDNVERLVDTILKL